MVKHSWRSDLVVCGFVLMTMAVDVAACPVCIGFPEKTTADFLLESRCVVFARNDEKNLFQYVPQEVLKGRVDGEINLLVDSVSRRLLRAEPGRQVLLVQEPVGGQWRKLGILNPEWERVVRRIMQVSASWNGNKGNGVRINFFLPLFGHPNQSIRELAYLELSRAPYPIVKKLGRYASRNDYAEMLTDSRYLQWRSLAILLLAQSEDPSDQQQILDSFHAARRFGLTTNLAALATAAIEIQGATAIDDIETHYFRNAQRTPNELKSVVQSLSMLGVEAETDLLDRIVHSYSVLLQHSPEFAPQVAEDLHRWKRTELKGRLATLASSRVGSTEQGELAIRRYLRSNASQEKVTVVHD